MQTGSAFVASCFLAGIYLLIAVVTGIGIELLSEKSAFFFFIELTMLAADISIENHNRTLTIISIFKLDLPNSPPK